MMRIVCLCGIDGAGKSTLFRSIKTSNISNECIFKSFNYRDNVNRFITSNPKIAFSSINIYSENYRNLLIDAYATDFIDFYFKEIEPLSNTDKVIICDRWFHCILAFERALSIKHKALSKRFDKCEAGTLIFYISVDPIIAFYRQSIINQNTKKNLTLLENYQKGYEDYFKEKNLNYYKIVNNNIISSFDEILNKIKQII